MEFKESSLLNLRRLGFSRPQNVRSVEIQENYQKMRENKKLEKSFSFVIANSDECRRIRTKSKSKAPCFPQDDSCADGFGRISFSYFPRLLENWEIRRKITDEIWGFFISPQFQVSRQRYDALRILVGRGTSRHEADSKNMMVMMVMIWNDLIAVSRSSVHILGLFDKKVWPFGDDMERIYRQSKSMFDTF